MNDKKKVFYAGIGSAIVSEEIKILIPEIAKLFANNGYILRTGNYDGVDKLFQEGANSINPRHVHLYMPFEIYNTDNIIRGNVLCLDFDRKNQLYDIEKEFYGFQNLSYISQVFCVRDMQILFGQYLNEQVDFVFSYVSENKIGTVRCLDIAIKYGIPFFNLYDYEGISDIRIMRFIDEFLKNLNI